MYIIFHLHINPFPLQIYVNQLMFFFLSSKLGSKKFNVDRCVNRFNATSFKKNRKKKRKKEEGEEMKRVKWAHIQDSPYSHTIPPNDAPPCI